MNKKGLQNGAVMLFLEWNLPYVIARFRSNTWI